VRKSADDVQAISKVIETGYDKGVAPVVQTLEGIAQERRQSNTGERQELTSGQKPLTPARRGQTPDVTPRSGSPAQARSPPPALTPCSAVGEKVPSLNRSETSLAEQEGSRSSPAKHSRRGSQSTSIQPVASRDSQSSQQFKAKRPFFNRLLLAGEVVLTSLEASVQDVLNTSTTAVSSAAG